MRQALVVWLLSCACAGTQASGSIHFEESYAGGHPAEFAEVLDNVKILVPGAIAYITGQWNLPNTLHYPLAVMVTETPPNLPPGAAAAYVRSVVSNGTLRQTLIVDLGYSLRNPGFAIDDLLYHEMAHAVLQDAVTGPSAAGIPQWLTEGLAQSVTREGHDRTAEDFKRYGHSDIRPLLCDLNGQVDTFYHGEYNFGCYTYFYLAVQRLLQKGGKETLPKVIDGLHNGLAIPAVIAQVTGMDWPAFQQNVERYARNVFSGDAAIP